MDSRCCIEFGLRTVYHLFGLPYLLKEPWEFALIVYMCFEDLQRTPNLTWESRDYVSACLDDVVLLASLVDDNQHTLVRFKAKCEVSELKIRASNSEAMVITF